MKDTIKKLLDETAIDVMCSPRGHEKKLRQALSRCAEIISVYEEALTKIESDYPATYCLLVARTALENGKRNQYTISSYIYPGLWS